MVELSSVAAVPPARALPGRLSPSGPILGNLAARVATPAGTRPVGGVVLGAAC